MTYITFEGTRYLLQENETVLECLLRHNVNYPSSCKSGVCQSCLGKITDGEIKPEWQSGLKDSQKFQNYFLPCIAKPQTDLQFQLPKLSECNVEATITEIRYLANNVVLLHLAADDLTHWIPGQYFNLINPKGVIRSYSIANIPKNDGFIELHIKLRPQGLMSLWVANEAKIGDKVYIRGPVGSCHYVNSDDVSYNMLLVGTGTGLAPLLGIVRHAIDQKHQGHIQIIHGGMTDSDLYYVDYLNQLSVENHNFTYDNCVLKSSKKHTQSSIDKTMLDKIIDFKNTRVYVCGPAETTSQLKKQAFLAGIPSKAIYSDSFV